MWGFVLEIGMSAAWARVGGLAPRPKLTARAPVRPGSHTQPKMNTPSLPGPTIRPDGTRDWTLYNAAVGGSPPFSGNAPALRELPGIAEARARGLAAQAEWRATRKTYEYANDDEGWIRVVRKKKRRTAKRSEHDAEEA